MSDAATHRIDLELFCCAGGMAEGFRRAGIVFDIAIDREPDHCDSYAANLGHRPVQMDVRDLVRMARLGLRMPIRLLVADPPCTPWSRAGKRLGTADERDMLEETCELIRLLRPSAYLIGNVPGLDDSTNWPIVQRVIGGLADLGYCVADFAALDAANYGVPQHRVRPFWFGHLAGPCLRWPAPTHGDPAGAARSDQPTLPGVVALRPWVTCRQALGHLTGDELGRPVRLRGRWANGEGDNHRPSGLDESAKALTRNTHGDSSVLTLNEAHAPASLDAPAPTMGARNRGQQGAQCLVTGDVPDWGRKRHQNGKQVGSSPDAPSRVVGTSTLSDGNVLVLSDGGTKHPALTQGPQSQRVGDPDAPAKTVQARPDRVGSGSPVLALFGDEEMAAPAPKRHQGEQPNRVSPADGPAHAVLGGIDRVGGNSPKLAIGPAAEWPWDRPSTTIQRDERIAPPIAPPGHHDENYSIMSRPNASGANAVILSERAATILQGFPEGWHFAGATKKARWSQRGQAMPPPLAHAVATSVVEQLAAATEEMAERGRLVAEALVGGPTTGPESRGRRRRKDGGR